MRTVKRQVPEEINWIDRAFENMPEIDKKMVSEALLDRWNPNSSFLVENKSYKITSQDLSVLCCERYLNDEVMNLLINKYCDEANSRLGGDVFSMLPSYVTAEFGCNAILQLCASVDITTTEVVFYPKHLNGNHWGLIILNTKKKEVQIDDGYHCPITTEIKDTTNAILANFHQATNLPSFQLSSWSPVQRFKVTMPDQPTVSESSHHGTGSCGVGVVCCVRDICNGFTQGFTWTFEDAPHLRAQLMVDLLKM